MFESKVVSVVAFYYLREINLDTFVFLEEINLRYANNQLGHRKYVYVPE